jgi:hypothetical protein
LGLALGILAIVAVTAASCASAVPARVVVVSVRATRQARFVSTVAGSGEISVAWLNAAVGGIGVRF